MWRCWSFLILNDELCYLDWEFLRLQSLLWRHRSNSVNIYLKKDFGLRFERTILHWNLASKLTIVRNSHALSAHSRNIWLTVLQWRASCTVCGSRVEPWVANTSDFDTKCKSGRANSWSAARRSVDGWACCTRRSFPGCTKEYGTHAYYNLFEENQSFMLELFRASTLVSLEKTHSVQEHF